MPSVALRSRRFGNRSIPSSSASPSSRASERAGYSRIRIMPSPRSTSRCGEPSVSRAEEEGALARQVGEVAPAKACIPSHRASSEVETSITRTFSVGRSASAPRHRHAAPPRRWRCRWRPGPCRASRCRRALRPTAAASAVPALSRARLPVSAPAPTSSGIATAGRHQRRAGVDALDQPGEAAEDQLRNRGVVDEARVGGVVMGDQDDRALGVGGAQLGDHGGRLSLGQQGAQAALSRAAGRRPPRCRPPRRAAPPAVRWPRSAASPATAPAPGGEAERPPEGAVRLARARLAPGRRRAPAGARRPIRRRAARPAMPSAGGSSERLDQARAATGVVEVRRGSVDGCAGARHRAAEYRIGKRPTARRIGRTDLRWIHACERHGDAVSRPRHPDRGRLLVVLRPLPDHLLALGLLPLDPRRTRRTRRPVPAGRGQRAGVLRLDPAARARACVRRACAAGSASPTSPCGCSGASRG